MFIFRLFKVLIHNILIKWSPSCGCILGKQLKHTTSVCDIIEKSPIRKRIVDVSESGLASGTISRCRAFMCSNNYIDCLQWNVGILWSKRAICKNVKALSQPGRSGLDINGSSNGQLPYNGTMTLVKKFLIDNKVYVMWLSESLDLRPIKKNLRAELKSQQASYDSVRPLLLKLLSKNLNYQKLFEGHIKRMTRVIQFMG